MGLSKLSYLLILGIPFLWILGVHVADVSRFLVLVLLLGALVAMVWGRRYEETPPAPIWPRYITWGILGCAALYSLCVPLALISGVYSGRLGMDFAIFTQVIDSLASRGDFTSTYIFDRETSFLSHHLIPFFLVPGGLTFLGLPPYLSGPIIHGFMLLLGWLGVMRLTHILGFPSPLGFIFCLLLLANPSFRHSVFWGIHDETYAIGIIPWIYVAWKQKRYVWTLVLAFICCLMKETMFLFTAMFLVMIAWEAEFGGSPQALASRRRLQLSCVFLALVCIGCFGSYIFLQPFLFGRPFDHLSKVTSLDSFLSAEYLTSKGLWLAYLFLPFVYAPFWKVRYWHFLLPAAPFVGFVMISSFAEMHKLNNYYAVIPSLLVFLASLLIYGEQQREQGTWQIRPTAVLFLVALSFSFATGKPTQEIFLQAWTKKALSPRPLEVIPPSSKVLATPSAALFLFRDRQVYIVEGAYEKFIPFEYIVTQTKELENLDPRLLQNVRKCMESEGWTIWCGGDSQLLARSGGQI